MVKNWFEPNFEKGLVSVIIPCYNQERFLTTCLESVTDQDYRPIEIIIIDDGSSDRTGQIMDDYQAAQSEEIVVKCIHQSKQGAQYARNQGCMQSRGEFIQYLDSDDVLFSTKLSQQVSIFNNNADVDIVYGDGQYVVNSGDNERKGRVIKIGESSDIIESLLFGYWVPSFAYLCKRSAVQLCGPWDNQLQIVQDFEYFLRMAIKKCRFKYSPCVTGLYRKHSFITISEQSNILRGRTIQRILVQAELCLRKQGEFNEKRALAIVENYRRIARQVYSTDIVLFKRSLDDILRLCPRYLPSKSRARLISKIIGFRNYEKLAAQISRLTDKPGSDWI